MTPDALATALAALERSRTPTVVVRPVAPHTTSSASTTTNSGLQYYTTPSMPLKWRADEFGIDEDDMPLNLGVEKVAEDDWNALGFKLPRRTGSGLHAYRQRGLTERNPPRRNGVEVDWDCGICLEPAADPCVTRCGHLFCERDLRMWFKTKPSEFQCPVCNSACSPERDVVPIFGRGRSSDHPASASAPRPDLQVLTNRALRSRRFASRTPSMEVIPGGGTESDTSAEPPSLTSSSLPSSRGTPTPSGTVTPAAFDHLLDGERDELGTDVISLLYPKTHPLARTAMISHELGRLLSLLGFVALMTFLLK